MNKVTPKLPLFLTLMVVMALLAGCGGGATMPEAPKKPLKVEFTSWWPDTAIVIAKEKGLFEKYGVQVEPVYYGDFSKALPDMGAKSIDGGLFSIGDAMILSQSTPLKVVSAYDDGGYNVVVASPEINSIADLKGKTIGAPANTSYELFVYQMLKSAGLTPSDVNWLNIGPEDVPAKLQSGEIQAGYTWDPTLAVSNGAKVIFTKEDAPGLFPDVIVFRSEVVEQRPEDIRAFLQAWYEASQYLKDNPEEARKIIAAYINVRVDQIVPDSAIQMPNAEQNLTLFSGVDSDSLSLQTAAKVNAEYMIAAGTLGKMPDLMVFLDSSFIK